MRLGAPRGAAPLDAPHAAGRLVEATCAYSARWRATPVRLGVPKRVLGWHTCGLSLPNASGWSPTPGPAALGSKRIILLVYTATLLQLVGNQLFRGTAS